MKARLGIAPIAWSNDDLPELGGDTPLEVCLSESREAGFSGNGDRREISQDAAGAEGGPGRARPEARLGLVFRPRARERPCRREGSRRTRSSSFFARTAPPSSSTARRPAPCRTSGTCRSQSARASTTSRCAPMGENSRPSPSTATTRRCRSPSITTWRRRSRRKTTSTAS